jgi:hypothetical protein
MQGKLEGKKLLNEIAKDIAKVAEKLDRHPADISVTEYYSGGGSFGEWQLRKAGGFGSVKATYFKSQVEKDLVAITDSKELRKQYTQLERELGDRELLLQRIKDAVGQMPAIKLSPYKPKKKVHKAQSRTLNLTLSDLHFGSDLSAALTNHQWGRIEEARALAKVVQNVVNYKVAYRDQTTLVVNILGDVIQNELHGRGSADILHFQTCRAMYLLTQALARFAENFKEVRVNFAVGNHGRDIAINPKRATAMKINALETTVYYGIINSLRNTKNIKFNFPQTPWVSYMAEGHQIYATHGDSNLNPGNPGARLEIGKIEAQVNKINASLSDHNEYKVFIVGHVHTALATQLGNGAFLIINGAMTPPDEFAKSLNIMESQQIQVMFETTKDHPVGDKRFINVTGSELDESLDEIIKPFEGLDK